MNYRLELIDTKDNKKYYINVVDLIERYSKQIYILKNLLENNRVVLVEPQFKKRNGLTFIVNFLQYESLVNTRLLRKAEYITSENRDNLEKLLEKFINKNRKTELDRSILLFEPSRLKQVCRGSIHEKSRKRIEKLQKKLQDILNRELRDRRVEYSKFSFTCIDSAVTGDYLHYCYIKLNNKNLLFTIALGEIIDIDRENMIFTIKDRDQTEKIEIKDRLALTIHKNANSMYLYHRTYLRKLLKDIEELKSECRT